MAKARSTAVEQAEAYYDSPDADAFYFHVWGGEDIHIGMYENDDEPIVAASHRNDETLASMLKGLGPAHRVLDIGAGYGGAARHLAKARGCHVTCVNISETQNRLNRELTHKAGLDGLVDVLHGDFENIPADDKSFDFVWSQDAILHSGNRRRVLDEVTRVLRPGGQFRFLRDRACGTRIREGRGQRDDASASPALCAGRPRADRGLRTAVGHCVPRLSRQYDQGARTLGGRGRQGLSRLGRHALPLGKMRPRA